MKENSYRNYLLTVLLLIAAFNYVDRAALGLLLQDIKIELALSDTQLGLLGGIAFALFYSLMGIPIAHWADRGNRVLLIAVTIALCSGAVALCGIAGSFAHLLLIRIGVAVGEAGCVPPAHSLIADYFSRAERPRAVARYKLGLPLSTIVGYFVAGWLNELYGWRTTFMLLGLPGLALAALAWLTLREPRLTRQESSVAPTDAPSFTEACRTLWEIRTFRHILLAYSLGSFFSNGIAQWKAAFFIRSFGMQTGELGTWFALIWGLGGLIGIWLGGELATRYAQHDERRQLRGMGLSYCGFGVVSIGVYLASDPYVALAFMGLAALGVSTAIAPMFATIQTLVPERMRAMSIALIFFVANLVGLGFGPLAAGALSDAFRPMFGEESLRYSLLVLCPGYGLTAWCLWRASATVTGEIGARPSPSPMRSST